MNTSNAPQPESFEQFTHKLRKQTTKLLEEVKYLLIIRLNKHCKCILSFDSDEEQDQQMVLCHLNYPFQGERSLNL